MSTIETDFVLKDDSTLKFDDPDTSIGRGSIKDVGRVVCYKIVLSSSTPENLKIYRNIQAGAFVQRFYGTLKANDNYYVVMEELDEDNTLRKACHTGSLPKSLLERVDLAYNVAKTMAWYHRAQLLLKSVSDNTVVLKQMRSGNIIPFLTRLENARHVG